MGITGIAPASVEARPPKFALSGITNALNYFGFSLEQSPGGLNIIRPNKIGPEQSDGSELRR
jgi:hypothetical protein